MDQVPYAAEFVLPPARGNRVVVPDAGSTAPEEIAGEVARGLEPGGVFLVGVRGREARATAAALDRHGLRIEASYWVRGTLQEPGFLVPADRKAVAWYWSRMEVPYSRRAALAAPVLALLARVGVQGPGFGGRWLVGQR